MSDSEVDSVDLLVTLAKAGIACPPTGAPLTAIKNIGPWHWCTADVFEALELYMFNVDLVVGHLVDQGPVFALCHYGHGVNSYGLNLVTWAGPVAAFLQHHYIGVYSDPVRDLVSINTTYSKLHEVLRVAAQVPQPLRWLMVASNFRSVCGMIDLDEVRAGVPWSQALRSMDSESTLFRSVAEKFASAFIDFDRIQW